MFMGKYEYIICFVVLIVAISDIRKLQLHLQASQT